MSARSAIMVQHPRQGKEVKAITKNIKKSESREQKGKLEGVRKQGEGRNRHSRRARNEESIAQENPQAKAWTIEKAPVKPRRN